MQEQLPSSSGNGPSLGDLPHPNASKCYLVTSQIHYTLSFLLTSIEVPDIRLAWRGEAVVCFLVFLMFVVVIFYIIFFGKLLCPQFDKAWLPKEVVSIRTISDYFLVSMLGQVYDMSSSHPVLACPTADDPKLAIQYRNFAPADPSLVHTSG
jgi:hypothetical protein